MDVSGLGLAIVLDEGRRGYKSPRTPTYQRTRRASKAFDHRTISALAHRGRSDLRGGGRRTGDDPGAPPNLAPR